MSIALSNRLPFLIRNASSKPERFLTKATGTAQQHFGRHVFASTSSAEETLAIMFYCIGIITKCNTFKYQLFVTIGAFSIEFCN